MAPHCTPDGDRRTFDEPLHVSAGPGNTLVVFFPDGHRLILTAEAAERSAASLWRSAVSQRTRRRGRGRPARRSGQVIAVDFAGPPRPS